MFLDWVLYIVVVTQLPGFTPTQKIGAYATQEECEDMKEYVARSMAEAYAKEKAEHKSELRFSCVYQPKKVRA